ncbi:TCP-1/cpn60 chaperonin family protein [Natronorubrum halophilum]|uniref:TCP-1/cpn60 chaperonin family protein n=1 Tax=Natronorubrum halophilum TaxID=1702106 RepID=UPI000EF69F1A|nr:TCP-1/cpn60 chaperonin family protein [Natronorubrum halophilum]
MATHNETAAVSWEQLSPEETRRGIRQAAGEMGELVRSTLGPLGADKMIVRRMGDDTLRAFVTNNGVAILEEFEGETDHPIANRFIALAEDHEDALGDGSTTTVLLASELLTSGIDLIESGVPPVSVVEGFSIGAQRTLEVWDEIGIPVASTDRPTTRAEFDGSRLERVAHSGMTNGRLGAWPLEELTDDVVDAVFRAWEPRRGRVHIGYVSIEAIPGGNVTSSSVIPGALLTYEPMIPGDLPVDGTVLLVDGSLQPREISASSVTVDTDYVDRSGDRETESERIAAAVTDSNCTAVFVTGDVTDEIGQQLAARGVVCFRNVKDSSIDVLSRVTGATIRGPVTPGEPASPGDLGRGTIRVREAQNDKTWLEVTAPDGADPRTVGLVVRGGTESAADEAKRRITGGLNAVRAAIKRPVALPGGGAAEVEAARAVRQLAPRFDGREQLAVEEFATVLESIPRTLARNAGADPIDAITDLRVLHDAGHARAGIDASGRIVEDVVAASDGLDAQLIRTNNLAWSVEFANSLFRVDNVVFDTSPPIDPDEIRR